jgi:hypothetical protein
MGWVGINSLLWFKTVRVVICPEHSNETSVPQGAGKFLCTKATGGFSRETQLVMECKLLDPFKY